MHIMYFIDETQWLLLFQEAGTYGDYSKAEFIRGWRQ